MSYPLSTPRILLSVSSGWKSSVLCIFKVWPKAFLSAQLELSSSKLFIMYLSSLNQNFSSWSTGLMQFKSFWLSCLIHSVCMFWPHKPLFLGQYKVITAYCFDIWFSLSGNLSPNYCLIRLFLLFSEVLCISKDINSNSIFCGPITLVQWFLARGLVILQVTFGSLCR